MTQPPTKDEFVSGVREAFAFLLNEHGFVEDDSRTGSNINEFEVTFVNGTTKVLIEGVSWGTAAMVFVGPRNSERNSTFDLVPVWAIAKMNAPDHYHQLSVGNQLEQVHKNAVVLKELAPRVLDGDFSALGSSRAFLIDRVKNPDAYR